MSNEDLVIVQTNEIPWADGRSLLALPEGVEVKLLRHVPEEDNRREFLVRFPPGYFEPEHTHKGEHASIVLEGKQIVGGQVLSVGDYLYGPRDLPHGPFDYPEGCVIFCSTRGDMTHQWS